MKEQDKELLKRALCSYLPYGLMVQDLYDDKKSTLISVNFQTMEDEPITIYNHVDKKRKLSEVKLTLRPLSDLTKEIEYNGEKFVPIVELLKEVHPYDDYSSKYGLIDYEFDGFWVKAYYKSRANYDISLNVGFIHNWPNWIIEKLNEWHFDTKGLIEKEYAIDKNTLK